MVTRNSNNTLRSMTNVFISHSSKDKNCGNKLVEILRSRKYRVFFSSVADFGITPGDNFKNAIDEKIKECDIFISLITPNYLRSQICLYELSIAKFCGKQIVPILATADLEKSLTILPNEIHYIKADDNTDAAPAQLCKIYQFKGLDKRELSNFFKSLSTVIKSDTPYIGQTEENFKNINNFCDDNGITILKRGQVLTDEAQNKLFANSSRIIICSTTGASLIKAREKAITEALKNGAEINIILPQKDSDYCNEVADLEAGDALASNNRLRISKEFGDVMFYLKEAFNHAQKDNSSNIGKISCYCSQTLLRQTIVLCLDKIGNASGFLNLILSPMRTVESPAFAFNGNIKTGVVSTIYNHLEALIKNAITKSLSFCINETNELSFRCDPVNSANEKQLEIERYWISKRADAEKYTSAMSKHFRSKVLIEVAAQHPLVDGLLPNEEFTCRLQYAIKLYNDLTKKGKKVYIFVPGSIHKYYGTSDQISLSEAGINFLINNGIEREFLYGDEANIKYKGDAGVYNSADECFVATKIFKDEKFGEMISICSTFQSFRKYFFYIEFGIVPKVFPITVDDMYHSPIEEYFGSLTATIHNDHNWQKEGTHFYETSRKERMP